MEEHLLRIATINFNEILMLLNELCKNNLLETSDFQEENIKDYLLCICEELESSNLIIRFNALNKLILLLLNQTDINFMVNKNIEENFNINYLLEALNIGLLNDLIKNLAFFYQKFLEYNKEIVNLKKMKLIFYIKLNLTLIFLFLFYYNILEEVTHFVKNQGDELEEIILRFLKLSSTHKYIPNRLLICVHIIYIKILLSEENELIETCRKIEKKDKYLSKNNFEKYFKPTIPKFFYDYEKENKFIEKFYRKNMIKKEKTDIERVVIVNMLKTLLAIIELNTGELVKEYIPELIIKYNLDNDELSDINVKNLFESINQRDKDFYNAIELINKVSITSMIIGFYYIILKKLQNYDLIQYTYFAFHLIDSNGLLVFLRILNLDFKSLEQQLINIAEQNIINNQISELIEIIILYNLKVIYKTCYKNDEYIQKYLVDCKTHIMLRKILFNYSENENLKKNCLKLIKCQLKFYDKNWRIDNSNLIINIYTTLKFKNEEEIDNYLKYEKKEKLKDQPSDLLNNDDLKKIHLEYHQYNYTRFFNPDEVEKYQNLK